MCLPDQHVEELLLPSQRQTTQPLHWSRGWHQALPQSLTPAWCLQCMCSQKINIRNGRSCSSMNKGYVPVFFRGHITKLVECFIIFYSFSRQNAENLAMFYSDNKHGMLSALPNSCLFHQRLRKDWFVHWCNFHFCLLLQSTWQATGVISLEANSFHSLERERAELLFAFYSWL
jgi:hypothetical protein